jgi:fucose 4-O-acetylase-like acetyltransferase
MTGAKPRDDGIDAVKGALLLLVILGHLPSLVLSRPEIVNSFYTFHVAGFLLLTFFYDPPPPTRQTLVTYLIRYGVPFVVFYTFYSVLYFAMVKSGYQAPGSAFDEYVTGLIFATSRTLDPACGLKMMWFLPTLFTLTIVRSLLSPFIVVIAVPAMLVAHLLVGEIGSVRYFIPWGLAIVAFLLPLGYAAPPLLAWIERRKLFWLLLLVCAGLHGYAFAIDLKVDLGDMKLFGLRHVPHLLLQDALMLGTTLVLLCMKRALALAPFLVLAGRYSLPIYLTHPLITQGVQRLVPSFQDWALWVQAVAVLALTLLSGACAALAARQLPGLYRLLFPRNALDLRLAH